VPRLPANAIELEYETFGDPGATGAVLIMGLGAQMVAWPEDFCVALARRGHFVVRFDNRDVGLSTKIEGVPHDKAVEALAKNRRGEPVRAPYLLRDMAADTADLIRGLGLERAHVVGVSMGGMVAQELAIHFPERVASLTSIMSSTGASDLPGPTPEAQRVLLAPPPRTREEAVAQALEVWRVISGPGYAFDAPRVRARAERSYDRCHHPPGVERQLVAIAASPSRREALRGLAVPTLVVHGEDDPLVPAACGRDTLAAIPDAEGLFLPGMGHDLPVELYETLADAIAATARRSG